jgi:hypothetical protein
VKIEQHDLRITSDSPITVRAVSLIDGEVHLTEMNVAELKLMIESRGKNMRLDQIIARLEK